MVGRRRYWCMLNVFLFFAMFSVVLLPAGALAENAGLFPNQNTVIDVDSDSVVMNGHVFSYDVMSGATVIPSRQLNVKPMSQEEKDAKMFWTVQPPHGLIEGEYYTASKVFNVGKDGHTGYTAVIDLVVDKGRIVHVEMDELTPSNYYSPLWRGQRKRTSGYGFFQSTKTRTDSTLVTIVNGLTFLEWQILKANSLNIDFDTVYGSSNSARDGFIPVVKELLTKVQKPSGMYYIGYALPQEDGLTLRLELVFEGKKIVGARYNEIFADTKEEIKDEHLKQYFRQSKRDSVYYRAETGGAFNAFVDALTEAVVAEQRLDVVEDKELPEAQNYLKVAQKIQPAVEEYLKKGYSHDVGKIAEKPANWHRKGGVGGAHLKDLSVSLVPGSAKYDPDKQAYTVTVRAKNTGDSNYLLHLRSFIMNVKTKDNAYDTVGNGEPDTVTLKPGEEREETMTFVPVYATDTQASLKFLQYSGVDKLQFVFKLPNP